jgi:hypothetical protein
MTTETETKKPKTAKEFFALNFPPKAPEKEDLKHATHFVPAGERYPVDGVYKSSKLDTELTAMKKRGERVLDIEKHGDHYEVTVMVHH